jgi:hypothetical protein
MESSTLSQLKSHQLFAGSPDSIVENQVHFKKASNLLLQVQTMYDARGSSHRGTSSVGVERDARQVALNRNPVTE